MPASMSCPEEGCVGPPGPSTGGGASGKKEDTRHVRKREPKTQNSRKPEAANYIIALHAK